MSCRLNRGRRARGIAAAAAAFVMAVTGSAVEARPAQATVASDLAQIVQLSQRIAAQGKQVKALVSLANNVQTHIHALDSQIAVVQGRLDYDQRQETAAVSNLQRVAVRAYMTGVGLDVSALGVFGSASTVTSMLEQNHYLGAVSDSLTQALSELRSAQARSRADEQTLQSEQAQSKTSLRQLATARRSAQAAIAADEATLNHVKDHLHNLIVAAGEQAAAQLAAERALALLPWSATAGPPAPVPPPTPGTYASPLRAIRGLTPERIDQGVDFAGFGPIYAIGDGVVLATAIPGWPGGTFIAYQLTDGPANGLLVYAAEDILPAVQIGDVVNANTVLGLMYPGPDGIETGWADGTRIGNTMARTYRQFNGANSTAFGYNFAEFLQTLGAPGGVPQNFPPTGALPPDWPTWPPAQLSLPPPLPPPALAALLPPTTLPQSFPLPPPKTP